MLGKTILLIGLVSAAYSEEKVFDFVLDDILSDRANNYDDIGDFENSFIEKSPPPPPPPKEKFDGTNGYSKSSNPGYMQLKHAQSVAICNICVGLAQKLVTCASEIILGLDAVKKLCKTPVTKFICEVIPSLLHCGLDYFPCEAIWGGEVDAGRARLDVDFYHPDSPYWDAGGYRPWANDSNGSTGGWTPGQGTGRALQTKAMVQGTNLGKCIGCKLCNKIAGKTVCCFIGETIQNAFIGYSSSSLETNFEDHVFGKLLEAGIDVQEYEEIIRFMIWDKHSAQKATPMHTTLMQLGTYFGFGDAAKHLLFDTITTATNMWNVKMKHSIDDELVFHSNKPVFPVALETVEKWRESVNVPVAMETDIILQSHGFGYTSYRRHPDSELTDYHMHVNGIQKKESFMKAVDLELGSTAGSGEGKKLNWDKLRCCFVKCGEKGEYTGVGSDPYAGGALDLCGSVLLNFFDKIFDYFTKADAPQATNAKMSTAQNYGGVVKDPDPCDALGGLDNMVSNVIEWGVALANCIICLIEGISGEKSKDNSLATQIANCLKEFSTGRPWCCVAKVKIGTPNIGLCASSRSAADGCNSLTPCGEDCDCRQGKGDFTCIAHVKEEYRWKLCDGECLDEDENDDQCVLSDCWAGIGAGEDSFQCPNEPRCKHKNRSPGEYLNVGDKMALCNKNQGKICVCYRYRTGKNGRCECARWWSFADQAKHNYCEVPNDDKEKCLSDYAGCKGKKNGGPDCGKYELF